MANVPLHSTVLIHERPQLLQALTEVLASERRPTRVRILTATVGPFDLHGSASFSHKLQMLRAIGATVTLVFGEDPNRLTKEKQEMLMKLEGYGVGVYHRRTMHAKLVVAYWRNSVHLFMGSANMTRNAFESNDELAIRALVQDPATLTAVDEFVNKKIAGPATRPIKYWSDYWWT